MVVLLAAEALVAVETALVDEGGIIPWCPALTEEEDDDEDVPV